MRKWSTWGRSSEAWVVCWVGRPMGRPMWRPMWRPYTRMTDFKIRWWWWSPWSVVQRRGAVPLEVVAVVSVF